MDERDKMECVGCSNKLETTKYFCSMICADNFRLSEEESIRRQQEEEIGYIRAICYGDGLPVSFLYV